MTLDAAIAKADAFVERFYDDHYVALLDTLDGATEAELAAITERHEQNRAEGRRMMREMVTAAWHTGTGGVH